MSLGSSVKQKETKKPMKQVVHDREQLVSLVALKTVNENEEISRKIPKDGPWEWVRIVLAIEKIKSDYFF